MTLTILDFILILILFFFTFSGFWFGLIHALGVLVGTIVGVLVAGQYFEWLADLAQPIFGDNENLAKIVAFIVIFIIVNRLVGLLFWLLNKVFKTLSIIPFLKTINRLAGAIFGAVSGIILVAVLLVFGIKFPFAEFLLPAIENSQVADWLLSVGKIILPFLPKVIEEAKSYLPF